MRVKAVLVAVAVGLLGMGLFSYGAATTEAAGPPANIQFVSPTLTACGVGTGTVSVLVTDSLGNPVDDGTLVSFSIDQGTITPVTTTSGGFATAFFNTASFFTTPTITASAGFTSAQISVPTICASGTTATSGPFNISTSVVCGSHSATVTVTITDQFGNPVSDGTPVAFSVQPGSITPGATTVNGSASVVYTPGPNMTGQASMTVLVNGVFFQGLPIDCGPTGGPPAQLSIRIPQSSVSCGSQAYVMVTATDLFGNPVADGNTINFASAGGTIIPANATDAGSALSEFTATPLSSGVGRIVASFGDVTATAVLPVTCSV